MQGEVIAIADIEGAERVMGVAYTAAERSQMVGNLQGQIASALARRKVRLDNSTADGDPLRSAAADVPHAGAAAAAAVYAGGAEGRSRR